MKTKEEIKLKAKELGAEAVGVSDISRFINAPKGFHPQDIYKSCKSVIVLLKSMPIDLKNLNVPEPYSHTAFLMYSEMDHLLLYLSRWLTSEGIGTIPLPSDVPYSYWEPERRHGRGLLSMRHAAQNAGLGTLGKNTLLINKDFGNMVYIGAVLVDIDLPSDPIVKDFKCSDTCTICLEACPQNALDGLTVNQALCREICTKKVGRDFEIYSCNECRKACPNWRGYKH
jgi:epoxyqueuosine reductase QueG